ncbi:Probable methyltransferase TARBP1 (TAR RNA-binding protein 1) (TAR RNA-binding protein of 185 kDa) (TRP-185) [Durusdinium trenchii]|uniref:Probable methyltransferase TARBP1 (TAR RNA-binding protein 1) (TAR RNA-binding protein of 185 kDa) (TRP-185) n=1 Tax=Durusdinium trenchii TaxID=1381693 RepID=A0ABP0M7G6_9DINO
MARCTKDQTKITDAGVKRLLRPSAHIHVEQLNAALEAELLDKGVPLVLFADYIRLAAMKGARASSWFIDVDTEAAQSQLPSFGQISQWDGADGEAGAGSGLIPWSGPHGHPDFALSEGNELEQLWSATIAWSASYVHQPRLLASLVLFHALEEQRIRTPGWYLEALHQQVRDASAFKKLRSKVKIEDWISDCWREVLKPTRPLDVQLAKACKQVAGDFWSPPDEDADEHVSGSHQRRPERPGNDQGDVVDIVVCASLVDNVPNMAGLVRTSEALLGRRVEVALRNEKVLQEASFQKMVVAADKSVRLSSVPCGPRLLAFLREHRSAGREVIALEQTSSSEMLQAELRLPQRFVLLLGSEQEGLPAWLLQSGLVDRCIELPLRGQTGSLNVHVAAAMLLWHYRLQH